jgi:23S rRNA (uracil1939-C5)-methyltransferase
MKQKLIEVRIERLNERGYGIGHIEGKEVRILNTIPGEIVAARIFKRKRGIWYGTAERVTKESTKRLKPLEDHFLACSPWQIIPPEEEINIKEGLIKDFYSNFADTTLPEFKVDFAGKEYNYRNKFEFSFYSTEEALSFAFHKRDGGKAKYSFDECILAPDKINTVNKKILRLLNDKKISARQLKGLLCRYSFFEDKVIAALYAKDTNINITPDDAKNLIDRDLKGFLVMYSDPRSPAFIETDRLTSSGDTDLVEKIMDLELVYPFDAFFQVNPAVFELAMKDIIDYLKFLKSELKVINKVIDLYAGIGTIGLIVSKYININNIQSVETYKRSVEYANKNKEINNISNLSLVQDQAESILPEYLKDTDVLILDPPRTGLHKKLITQVLSSRPKYIIYLSCNPGTQAQDFNELKSFYSIEFFKGYNFYPHTPHVESLLILKLQ